MTRLKIPFAILAVSALVALLVGFNTSRQTTNATAAPQSAVVAPSAAAQLQTDFVNVYKKVAPSVVQIETAEGLGSGIVFDAKGHIVTNAHVVGDGQDASPSRPRRAASSRARSSARSPRTTSR